MIESLIIGCQTHRSLDDESVVCRFSLGESMPTRDSAGPTTGAHSNPESPFSASLKMV